jgi:hypothetical protein
VSEYNQYPPTLKWPNANKADERSITEVTFLDNGGKQTTLVPDGHPVRLFFPYGDARPNENKFGMSYRYAADLDGKRHTIFANGKLHEALQRGGVGPTITLEITRNVVPMTEFVVSRVATEDGGTVDEFVEAMGGDLVGGQY